MRVAFFLFLLLLFSCSVTSQEEFVHEYYSDGTLKSAGWLGNGKKIRYWKFYYANGKLKEEGRFLNGQKKDYWYFYRPNGAKIKEGRIAGNLKNGWWIFYDKQGLIIHKCQYKADAKNGYCLLYDKGKLIKASKYSNGNKLEEWKDLSSFRRDNNMSDLSQ